MLKKKLKVFPYNSRQEFEELRRTAQGVGTKDHVAFGGSDIGKITGMSEYTSPLVFFYEMTGYYSRPQELNMHMIRGLSAEEHIYKQYFRFFDIDNPDEDTFKENWIKQKPIRKAVRKNALIINPDFPHLFFNVDYLRTATTKHPKAVLELKAMLAREMDKYEEGIPYSYVNQLYTYMGGLEIPHGELFVLKEFTYPVSYQYQLEEENFNKILNKVNDFASRILEVKKVMHSDAPLDEINACIHENEPPLDSSEDYGNYLKDKHKPENLREVEGTDELFKDVLKYLRLKEDAKELIDESKLLENKIKKFFIDHEATHITFKNFPRLGWVEKFSVPSSILKKYRKEIEQKLA